MLEKLRQLRRDDGGAIMVTAVFFSAFLVGALWYVVGVGNAALFREQMQNGADASGFAAAVYHARGMNIIAMINLIMAAILAVLVALKIALLLLTVTNIIVDAICAIEPFGAWACPFVPLTATGIEEVNTIIKAIEPGINTTLKVLSKVEVGVAIAMPWLAEAKTYSVASGYGKPVDGALMLSESLIPTSTRLGLPVQEDKYIVLCTRAADFVAQFALAPFAIVGVPTSWANGLVEGLVKSAPSYFCGDDGGGSSGGSGSSGSPSGSDPDALAKKICGAQKSAIDESNKNNKGKKNTMDYDKCIKDQTKNAKAASSKSLGSSSSGGNGKTPKKVFDDAKNGNRYMNITAYAWGDLKPTRRADRRIRIPAFGKTIMKAPDFWGKIQFTEAEFYYEHGGTWDSYKDDAMWNMRWRARLRRYHDDIAPDHGIITKVMSVLSVANGVMDAINRAKAGGLSGLDGDFLGGGESKLQDLYIQNAKKTGSDSGFQSIDTSSKMESIH